MRKIRYLLGVAFIASINYSYAQGVFSIEEQFRSAQSLGMGGLSIVNEANAFSVYENSSAVAFSEKKVEIGLQYSPWAKELTKGMDRDNLMMNTAGYYSINDKHKVLAGFSYYAPGGNKMFNVDENGNVVGDEIRSKYISFNIGYSYRINDNLGVSAGVNYANWNDGFNTSVGFTSLNIGLTNRFNLKSDKSFIDVAFRMNGWGVITEADSYKAPGFISLGAMFNSKQIDKHMFRVGAMLEYRCLDQSGLRVSLGGEYGFNDLLFVRGGYNFVDKYNNMNGYGTVGFGVKIVDKCRIDLSYLLTNKESQLRNTYMVGLEFMF